jgi:hypothetical protein
MLNPLKPKWLALPAISRVFRIRQNRAIGTRLACKGSRHYSKIAIITANQMLKPSKFKAVRAIVTVDNGGW